jgi:hypothetical protein
MLSYSFHGEATERVSGLLAEKARFEELGEAVVGHLEELSFLASFYARFQQAYAQLGGEVGRRRRALEGAAEVGALEGSGRAHRRVCAQRGTWFVCR